MIKVFSELRKGAYEIIAVAGHQRDINNLRLMSKRLHDNKDKVQLNKDKYGGPYVKISCDQFRDEEGHYDEDALNQYVKQLQDDYS